MSKPRQWLRMLRVRIVLWTVMLEALLLLVFAILLVLILQNSRNQQIDETLRLGAVQMNAVVDVHGSVFEIPAQDISELQSRGIMVWLLSVDGSLGATVGRADQYPVPNPLPNSDAMTDSELSSGEPLRLFVTALREGDHSLGTLILGLPLKAEFMVIQQLQLSLLVSIPIVLMLSAIGGLFLANRALSPISSISEAARQISATDLGRRIELNLPDDEVGQLAHTFNEMLERIDDAFRRERQFTSDASHELRTPLGFMKTQLSLARSKQRSSSELLEMMGEMENDVDRMTRLIEQMLVLARMENQELPEKQIIDLAEIVRHLSQEYGSQAQTQNVLLLTEIPEGLDFHITGIPELIHQVLVNLLENAFKYTNSQATIQIRLQRRWQQIYLILEDNGQGIPAEHLPHLFERFYRVDSARTRESGGFGLGLAITKAIIEAHGGQIRVESKLDKGTICTIIFSATHAKP